MTLPLSLEKEKTTFMKIWRNASASEDLMQECLPASIVEELIKELREILHKHEDCEYGCKLKDDINERLRR